MERNEGAAKVGAGETAAIRASALAKAGRLENSCREQLAAAMKNHAAAELGVNKAQYTVDALAKEIKALHKRISHFECQKLRIEAMSDDEIADEKRTADWIFGTLLKKPGEPIEVVCLGANMSPTIKEGELVHVDTGVRKFSGNGIYCLEVGEFRLIRRLIECDDGTLIIVSDNKNKLGYPDQPVPVDERWKITIAGKVVCWVRVCKP